MVKREEFLTSLLGQEGCKALKKATDHNPDLALSVIVRSLMGWLDVITRQDFQGKIPGTHYACEIKKNQSDTFSGHLKTKEDVVSFNNASLHNVAGAIATVLGVEDELPQNVDNTHLAALGKSIDLLIKARIVTSYKQKPVVPQKLSKSINLPRPSTRRVFRIAKASLTKSCSFCQEHFFKNDQFVGCHCFSGLSGCNLLNKSTEPVLSFNRSWDQEAITTLLEALKV